MTSRIQRGLAGRLGEPVSGGLAALSVQFAYGGYVAAAGLAAIIESRRTFWYSCQKLIPADAASWPDWRHSVLAEAAPGLWAAYAGKFTMAPVLAGYAARLLSGALPCAPGTPGQGTVDIADQPFRADRAALVP